MTEKRITNLKIFCAILLIISVPIGYLFKNKEEKIEKQLKGTWIADGTQFVNIIGYENGEYIYSDTSEPFYLTFHKNKYMLKTKTKEEKGTYSVNENEIILENSDGIIIEHCKLKKEELLCNSYASSFKKEENK